MVRVRTSVDGSLFTTYACDGLIVATATGSTAYALAAGGPILPPVLKNIILVPIAPHLSLDKPIVLSQGSVVEMIVGTDHQAILTNDGQDEVTLKSGDRVVVQASNYVARFARVQSPNYFYHTLMSRLKSEPCE
jgi:NAD+ kinase